MSLFKKNNNNKYIIFTSTDISSEGFADSAQIVGTSTKHQFAGFSRQEDAGRVRGAGEPCCIVLLAKENSSGFLPFFEDAPPVPQEAASLPKGPVGAPGVEVLLPLVVVGGA